MVIGNRFPLNCPTIFPTAIGRLRTRSFKNGSVHPDNSDEQAWMQWITILSWDDEDTAVVEEGVWCCPLGGGASESTYRKVDGEWKQIDYGGGWVS